MPNHKKHEKINLSVLVIIIIMLLYINLDYTIIFIFILSFLFSTFFVTPDLDINSKIYKRWGIIRLLWRPYRDIFKHRKASHHLLWGPVSLIGYFSMLVVFFIPWDAVTTYEIAVILAGMVAAIELHIIADRLS